MLHVGVLPHHDRWGDVLSNLRYVVVDEAHVYRGVFGSHVGNVLRRLRRLARVYGADPQFLLASATIANPGELALALTGLDFTVIGADGAPKAERTVALWNPPLVDEELGQRASALAEASKLMADLVERGLRTLVFAKSRRSAELIHKFTADRSARRDRLSPYRAGYTAAQRREIEQRLFAGELLGVSATNALELGIDVGMLDAVISVGFRERSPACASSGAARDAAITGWPSSSPVRTRSTSTSCASRRRFSAAAWRRRFSTTRTRACSTGTWPPPRSRRRSTTQTREILGAGALGRAAEHPELAKTARATSGPAATTRPRAFWPPLGEPGRLHRRRDRDRLGARHDRARARLLDRPRGRHLSPPRREYRVVALDLVARSALVEPFVGDYYTQAKKETMTSIEETLRAETRLGLALAFGRVSVTEQVVGYQRKSIRDQSTLELVGLDLPETTFETEAVWYVPEAEQLEGLTDMPKLLGTLHAAEHAMIAILPLWAMCDRWDIGGLSTNIHYQTGRPTVFVYDGHSGGVGITERGFDTFEGWVEDTAKLLDGCPCESGCPSCVQSPKCGNLNEPLDKAGALELLGRMLAA